jgi:tetratricopeptide (TPR) repeat protein
VLEPDVFEGYFNLGNIYHDLGRYREAEDYYLHALAVNPRYPEAHLYLAVALEKDGRSEEARPHWRAYRWPRTNGLNWRGNSAIEEGPPVDEVEGPAPVP